MSVSMDDIKILRDKTGAGLMDCKKALVESAGNIEDAVDWLRKKGLSAAAKKVGRTAAEGVICLISNENRGTVLELNSETDFVARNEQFQQFAVSVTKIACEQKLDIESLKKTKLGDSTVEDALGGLIGVINENMSVRRVAHIDANDCVISTYLHSKLSDFCGAIGVLVAIKCSDKEKGAIFGKKVAMHVAASNPLGLTRNDIDSSLVSRERDIACEKQKALGKDDPVILEKVMNGAVEKFFQECVLLENKFLMDPKKTVKEVADSEGCEIISYVRYQLGEGIEKTHVDFASEVQAQLQ